ncbi:MAG: class I SAM-dependent methyltransferase [Bacteroidetes bacterium]|nr:MAG: class I SAM-dependent methyltransferase [Bacteroidota bacterium]
MLKTLLRPAYTLTHALLYQSRALNPWFRQQYGAQVGEGHISDEHLDHPELDDRLVADLQNRGIPVKPWVIDAKGYQAYLEAADYPADYYGGGLDPEANFTEKTLEHYVSTLFLDLGPDKVHVDMAACNSPFYEIVRRVFGVRTSYQQDLIYPSGRHGDRIGGWAHELDLPDGSVHAVTLHCSLEHFEGDSDRLFFQKLERVLAPGGRVVILPFYLAHTYTIHVDPAYNLLKGHRPTLDPKAALRYCSWRQFFSRHYDPQALQERLLAAAPSLQLTLYRFTNFREVHPPSYLRFAGVFEKVR